MSKREMSLARPVAAESTVEKLGGYAPVVMLGACALGLVSLFLPAVTVSFLGLSESVAVFRDWRGKLALLGYVGVAVMAGRMMRDTESPKQQVTACLTLAAVVALLAIWLPLSVSSGGGTLASAIKTGIGCYVNIAAALAMVGGAVVLAKREKVI
jgi:hypothetical protein